MTLVHCLIVVTFVVYAPLAVADTYTFTPSPAEQAGVDYVTGGINKERAGMQPPAPSITKQQAFALMVSAMLKGAVQNAKQKQTEDFLNNYQKLAPADQGKVDSLVGAPAPK